MLFWFISVALVVIVYSVAIRQDFLINECVDNIILRHVLQNELIVTVTEEIELNLSYPTLNNNGIDSNVVVFQFRRVDAYVIQVNTRNVISKFKYLSSMQMWNSHAKFIIIFAHSYSGWIFRILAKYRVYNVILLNVTNQLSIQISTYYPFRNFDANNLDMQSKIISSYGCGNKNITNLYVNKLPEIWINTILRVEYMKLEPYVMSLNDDISGIEIHLVKLIAGQMKFELELKRFHGNGWGKKLSNGTYTNIFGNLQTNKTDLGIGVFHANAEYARDFEMTFSHMGEDLVWVVPRAKLLQPWAKLIRIFSVFSWIMILAMLILTIASFYFISYGTEDYKNIWYSFEATYCTLIAISVAKVPSNNRVRLIFMAWCIFCLILKADFDASFICTLTTDSYEKQVETQRDIVERKLNLGAFDELINLYKYSNNENDIYIYNHLESCMINNDCLDRTAFKGDYATVKPRREINYLIDLHYLTPTGSMVYIIKDKIFRDLLNMYFKKGHPIFPQFNRYLLYASSSGFVNYWDTMMAYIIKLKHNSYLRKSSLRTTNVLNLTQLSSSFILLFLGLGISITAFCLELLWYKI